jgi:hypothetical protein
MGHRHDCLEFGAGWLLLLSTMLAASRGEVFRHCPSNHGRERISPSAPLVDRIDQRSIGQLTVEIVKFDAGNA